MLVRSEASSSLARIGLDPDIAQALLDDLKENGDFLVAKHATIAKDAVMWEP